MRSRPSMNRDDWKQVVHWCYLLKSGSLLELEKMSDLGDHWILFLWLRVHLMWYHVTLFQAWLQAEGIWHISLKWCELACPTKLGSVSISTKRVCTSCFFSPFRGLTSWSICGNLFWTLGPGGEHQVGWFKERIQGTSSSQPINKLIKQTIDQSNNRSEAGSWLECLRGSLCGSGQRLSTCLTSNGEMSFLRILVVH